MKKYNLYIISYDGKVRLYWNRILKAWTSHKGNASPYLYSEILELTNIASIPYGVRVCVQGE